MLPGQRMKNDGRKIIIAGIPPEQRCNLLGMRNNARGIARPSWSNSNRKVDAGCSFDRVNHFQNGKSAAISAVERQRWRAGSQVPKRLRVCAHEIADADIVADTSAIRRRVILPIYLQLISFADRGFNRNFDWPAFPS